MSDRKRSWTQVALVSAVAVLAVVQLVDAGWLFPKKRDNVEVRDLAREVGLFRCKYVPSDVFSLEKFNNLIGYTMTKNICETISLQGHDFYQRNLREPRGIVDLLAWTTDKDKPNTVVGKFSVKQLLDWSNLNPDQCTPDVLDKFRADCTELDPAKIGLPKDAEVRELVVGGRYYPGKLENMPLDYLRYFNLHRYCTESLRSLEKMCDYKQFLEVVSEFKVDTQLLDGFNDHVAKHIEANEIRGLFNQKNVVQKVLAKLAPAEAEKVKTHCADLVKKLQPAFGEIKNGLFKSDKRAHYEFCEYIVN